LITTVGPFHLSELVPARVRARTIGFTVSGSGISSVLAVLVVWATKKLNDQRQYMIALAIQVAAPVVLLSLTLLITESPFWLLKKGRLNEARDNLTSIRTDNPTLVKTELSATLVSLHPNKEMTSNMKSIEVLKPLHLELTLTAGALVCLFQVGRKILTQTYSIVILVQSGVANPFKITIIIFLLQFLGALVGLILTDKVGRRPVALIGFVILFIIDIATGSLAYAGLKTNSEALGLESLCITFAFANSVSFQSL
jgi:MFS family permease